MFISKKHISRRTVLKSAGATLALPLLDAMIPARTALAQTAAKPLPRMGFIYFPHGAIMEQWTPAAEGRAFPLSPILSPLEDFQQQLTVISGLGNPVADGPVHSLAPATWLSCTRPQKGQEPNMAPTCDRSWASPVASVTA